MEAGLRPRATPESVACALAVSAILVVAAGLRWPDLNRPGLWLDEVLSVRHVEQVPIFSRQQGPDWGDGPVFHTALKLSLLLDSSDRGPRIPSALAGALAVMLLFLVGKRWCGFWPGLVAATLLAVSPLHVYYSREARPYSLLVAIFLGGLLAGLGLGQASWMARFGLIACAVGLVLTSLNGVFYGAVLGLVVLVLLYGHGGIRRVAAEWPTVALLLLSGVLGWMLYAEYIAVELREQSAKLGAPPFSIQLLGEQLRLLFWGRAAVPRLVTWFLVGLGILGLAWAIRHGRNAAGLALWPVAGLGLPLGAMILGDHWVATRYVAVALPGFLLLMGAGVILPGEAIARLGVGRRAGAALAGIAAAAAAVLVFQAPIRAALLEKPDWRYVAEFVEARAANASLILASNDWTQICLAYHLERLGATATVLSAGESREAAERLLQGAPFAILATGGFHRSGALPMWMEQFPLLYSTSQEAIAVYAYPDRVAYLQAGLPADQLLRDDRFLWDSLLGKIIPGTNGARFLLDGWEDLEVDHRGTAFRWVRGTRSRIYVPLSTPSAARLELEVAPFAPHPEGQTMTVLLNDQEVGTARLEGGWQAASWLLPVDRSRAGANILELRLPHAARPRDLIRGSGDSRLLSVAVRSLRVRREP